MIKSLVVGEQAGSIRQKISNFDVDHERISDLRVAKIPECKENGYEPSEPF